MTKSDKFQTADMPDAQPLKKDEKELYNISENFYTQFIYSEKPSNDFDSISKYPTYPDDLPEDNVEAVLLLMKKSLTFENK